MPLSERDFETAILENRDSTITLRMQGTSLYELTFRLSREEDYSDAELTGYAGEEESIELPPCIEAGGRVY